METDQIVEHCHLVGSKGGQHVVTVVHGCLVDSVSIAPPEVVWWDAVPVVKVSLVHLTINIRIQ